MSGPQKLPVAEQAENPRVGEHGALSCGRALSFSRQTRDDLERLLARYPTKQATLLPTLWLAQREWGWISREAVDYVAALLDLSPAFVWGVVTFYTMYNRAPVGRHLIQVCTSISCHLNGAGEVYAECRKRLGNLSPGETTPDGKFTAMDPDTDESLKALPGVDEGVPRALVVEGLMGMTDE